MGLIQCVDCGAQMSDAAQACARCGRPAPWVLQREWARQQQLKADQSFWSGKLTGMGCLRIVLMLLVAIPVLLWFASMTCELRPH